MKRFILIVENQSWKPSDRSWIVELIRSSGVNVVDVRVASKHIEIDLLADTVPSIEGFSRVVEIVEVVERKMGNSYEEFMRAVRLFDSERFWEAHEALEPLWKMSKGDEKQALHGLILAAAAFVHLQKGDQKGFRSIIDRAIKRLDMLDIVLWGLNVKKLSKKLVEAAKTRKPFNLSSLFN